jgi:hypothetical protein
MNRTQRPREMERILGGEFGLFGFQRFMQQHLQVGLISQAALGSQLTGPRNVVRIEADGSGRSATSRPLASDSGGRAGMQPALVGCPLESMGEFLAVIKPPLGFFSLTSEFRNLEFVWHVVQAPLRE